jgi:hypothetical protein
MAANTFLSVLKQVIVAHNLSPPRKKVFGNEEIAQEALPCTILNIMFKHAIQLYQYYSE